MPLSLCLITPIKLSSTAVYEAGKLSVCLSVCNFGVTEPASVLISTGHPQNESCIVWNMQDYVYNYTGMKHQRATTIKPMVFGVGGCIKDIKKIYPTWSL